MFLRFGSQILQFFYWSKPWTAWNRRLALAAGSQNQPRVIIGEKYLKRLLWYILGGTRGGVRRAEILKELRTRPRNANQLAQALGVDYKTAQHHLRVLEENELIAPSEKGAYGAVYLLTRKMEEALPIFDEIWSRIGRTEIRAEQKGAS